MPTPISNNSVEFFSHKDAMTTFGGHKMNIQMAWMNTFKHATDGDVKFQALQMFILATWPEFVKRWQRDAKGLPQPVLTNKWNPWLERHLRAFTNTKYATKRGENIFRVISLTGAAGCGKTFAMGLYAVAWWMTDINHSIATLTSTTKDMIGQRVWPVISHFWQTAVYAPTGQPFCESGQLGDKVDSSRIIRAVKGDDAHAITALAVAHGETSKALHNLKGRHAPRMLLEVDEANGTPEAIFEVIPNMRKACADLTVIVCGNPGSRFDPHGRCLAPEAGWPTITEDAEEWRTKAVPEWQLDPGIALRFDGFKSPNIITYGRTVFPYIYTCEDKANALATPGYVGTLNYWVMERGLHPPEGTSCTVFSEQLFARCLDDKPIIYTFDSDVVTIAFFDPAFTSGGDSAWLQFARLGKVNDLFSIELGEGFEIPISPEVEAYDVDYQLARRVQQECIVRGVKPFHFGIDATAIGRGVGAILSAEWSSHINYTTWGGNASDLPSAQNDGRPGKEVYHNKVAELWFATREALESGQIRGFTRAAMSQACSRLFEMKNKRYWLEPKGDMKARMRYSPDEFDSCCGVVEVARRNGFVIEGKIAMQADKDWNASVGERDVLGIEANPETALTDGESGWAESSIDTNNVEEGVSW